MRPSGWRLKRPKPAAFGRGSRLGGSSTWFLVERAYLADDLQTAYEQALDLGTGPTAEGVPFFRMIEAEWVLRSQSVIWDLRPDFRLELILKEIEGSEERLSEWVLAALVSLEERLGWRRETPLLVSVLSEVSNVEWTPGRHGYFRPKLGFCKICVPRYSTSSEQSFRSVLEHELIHLAAYELSQSRCRRWLEEAVAMLFEAPSRWPKPGVWRSPAQLDAAFGGDQALVLEAYAQSRWMGLYLATLMSEQQIADLLRTVGKAGFWAELAAKAGLRSPVSTAFRRHLGMTEREFFRRSEDWASRS